MKLAFGFSAQVCSLSVIGIRRSSPLPLQVCIDIQESDRLVENPLPQWDFLRVTQVSFFAVLNPTATRSCLVGIGCTSINERSGWWAIGKTFWNANMKTILIWWKRANVRFLVSQGSAWEGNGERTVWFRRCPAAVKPLLAQAMVSQNARQSLNRRGSTCFFLMCKLLCTEPIFLLFTGFERISG